MTPALRREAAVRILATPMGDIALLLRVSNEEEMRIRREARELIETLDTEKARCDLRQAMLKSGVKMPPFAAS